MKKTKKVKDKAAVALGTKGGLKTKENGGSNYFRELAKKRWAKRDLSPTL